jgi:hypothetical protein
MKLRPSKPFTLFKDHLPPEPERVPAVKTYSMDAILSKLGGENQMWSNQCVAFAPTSKPMLQDWKCEYCGCIRPPTEYTCGLCGAPKK